MFACVIFFARMACVTVSIVCAMTLSNPTWMRLNSSKRAQAPAWARPLKKKRPVILKPRPSEQLETTTVKCSLTASTANPVALQLLGSKLKRA
eukprot:4999305-Heterocapsa_arctica.AAC.1